MWSLCALSVGRAKSLAPSLLGALRAPAGSWGTPSPTKVRAHVARLTLARRRTLVHAPRPAPHPLGCLRQWSPHILCFGS
jgi:hypothetical protein